MDIISIVRDFLKEGKKEKHVQVFTLYLAGMYLDVTYQNNQVKSTTLYSKDMKVLGWLTEEECKKITPLIQEYLNDGEDCIYY